ncbi:hypothetical protein NHQ30_008994 [Ciborinia camelliae]|nr:hypothetical protein NHQ30_008994 [Ciborinia camelliae]
MPTKLTTSSRILIAGGDSPSLSSSRICRCSFTDGEDDVSMILLNKASEGWLNDSVFTHYYHPTGYIVAAVTPAAIERVKRRELPDSRSSFVRLEAAEEFRKTMPPGVLTRDFPGWKGVFKSSGAGWVHARKALESAVKEAQRLGVKFIAGSPQGSVTRLIYEDGDVMGVKTEDGKEHWGDRTILAAGAGADALFDFKDQLRRTAWTLGHINMSEDEIKLYKNLPVLFNIEKGFFMEPDEDNHEIKICNEHPGYCNWDSAILIRDDGTTCRAPLILCPNLLLCGTPDRAFLIDTPPGYDALTLAVGGSGHGFMHITSVGGFVVDLMEGKLDHKLKNAFRWRPETAVDRIWKDLQGRFGGPNEIMDFQEVTEWTNLPTR